LPLPKNGLILKVPMGAPFWGTWKGHSFHRAFERRVRFFYQEIFNNLPSEIKNVTGNQKKIKIALKKFLYTYLFYTLEEYFS